MCLSTQKSPMKVKFEVMEGPAISGMLDEEGKSARAKGSGQFKDALVRTVVDVDCLPLFTLLAALDFPTVDFFSLDVEGAELGILQTIPWHQVNTGLTEMRSLPVPKLDVLLHIAMHFGSNPNFLLYTTAYLNLPLPKHANFDSII